MMKLLLTYDETIVAVSMSKSKIDRLIRENRFPKPVRIDGNVRFRMSDLTAWENGLSESQNLSPVQPIKRGRPRLSITPIN